MLIKSNAGLWGVGLLSVIAVSCTTNTAGPTLIESEPTGAFVDIEWQDQDCQTPCSIQFDRRTRISISKEGFITQDLYIDPSQKKIFITLELIAATEQVETTTLPEL